jgi:hypothetical protein
LLFAWNTYHKALRWQPWIGIDFNHHPKCGPLGITHLAFADDSLLFSKGDQISVRILYQCLREFEATFGLSANHMKTNIFSTGVPGYEKRLLMDITGFQMGEFPIFRSANSSRNDGDGLLQTFDQ